MFFFRLIYERWPTGPPGRSNHLPIRNHRTSLSRTLISFAICALVTIALATAQDDEEVQDPCKSNPCLNGICIGHLENNTYHCYCEDGFTGIHCETDWDECWSSPCLNGAECVDLIADFNCTCPVGFKGNRCETNIDECLSDPCLNNGTCVDDVAGYFCECQIGFSGHNCEIDVSVCNTTEGKKCQNGGRCVDGIGAKFTCECSEGWEGKFCQDNVNECLVEPCQNGGMCMDTEGGFFCSCPFGFTGDLCDIELERCDSNPCQNEALCFVVDDSYQCYCVPDFHGERCQFKYDDCQLPPWPKCFNGGECLDGVDDFSCSCPSDFSGTQCQCPEGEDETSDQCLNLNESIYWTLPPTTPTTSSETTATILPTTTFKDGDAEGKEEDETTEAGTGTDFDDRKDTDSSTDPTSLEISPSSPTPPIEPSSVAGDGDDLLIVSTSPVFAEQPTVEPTTTDFGVELSSSVDFDYMTLIPVTVVTESIDVIMTPMPTATASVGIDEVDESTEVTESGESIKEVTESSDAATEDALDGEGKELVTDLGVILEDEATTSPTDEIEETTSGTTELSSTESSVTETSSHPQSDLLAETACEGHVCRNGGSCFAGVTGAGCRCPLQFRGRQCEEETRVEVPGFVGHSLLVHKVDNNGDSGLDSPFSIVLSFRTSSPDGVLFYANGDKVDLSAQVKDGALVFRVSCGPQHIVFSDPRLKVDNGFRQTIELNLEVQDSTRCVAVIHLNETHTMSGEQEIDSVPLQPSVIYFGQMPSAKNGHYPGFRGCISYFQLNGVDMHLYDDAARGRDIVECAAAACAVKPCQNGAVCTQHEDTSEWFCNCPAGYTGTLCERPVCESNPCRRGGTCLSSVAGPGFLCLCPLGSGGVLCNEDVNVTQPSFTHSVGGYSSFLALPLASPSWVSSSFDAQFHLSTSDADQIALLVFVGGRNGLDFGIIGGPDHYDAYLAVSYVKGHVLLTWDMGAGPRRIFTKRPVDTRYFIHSVRFGLSGRNGWLQVDRLANVTGRAPGIMSHMNVSAKYLYLGGHVNHNLTFLPHDLPVHRGFDGCIFDFSLRAAGATVVPVGEISLTGNDGANAAKGRNVFQCRVDACATAPCENGGTCVGYGASYVCSCADGWFGINCQETSSECTVGKRQCDDDARCAVHANGTSFCLCPLGKKGNLCKKEMTVSDPHFDGVNSVMWLRLDSALRFSSHISLFFKPDPPSPSADGVIAHIGQGENSGHDDFFSLALINGSVSLVINLGGPSSRQDRLISLTLCCAKPGEWNRVEAGRTGRDGYLRLNGQTAKGTSPMALTTLDVDNVLYIGGLDRTVHSHLPPETFLMPTSNDANVSAMAEVGDGFAGCVREVEVNGLWVPLTKERGWKGWQVSDCDGTACGGELCRNGGECSAVGSSDFECACAEPFTGRTCTQHRLCSNSGDGRCLNGGECKVEGNDEDEGGEVKCHCPLGFSGRRCEEETSFSSPSFDGDGHLSIRLRRDDALRDHTSVSLDFKTNNNDNNSSLDALIFWVGGGHAPSSPLTTDDYLGLGMRRGRVHLVWNLGWFSRTELTVPSIRVDDGNWHRLEMTRARQSLDLVVDGERFGSQVAGSYFELNTEPVVFIGGAAPPHSTLDFSRGHFSSGFSGCVRSITVQNSTVAVDNASVQLSGVNVGECEKE